MFKPGQLVLITSNGRNKLERNFWFNVPDNEDQMFLYVKETWSLKCFVLDYKKMIIRNVFTFLPINSQNIGNHSVIFVDETDLIYNFKIEEFHAFP